jgi:hypothetical protein
VVTDRHSIVPVLRRGIVAHCTPACPLGGEVPRFGRTATVGHTGAVRPPRRDVRTLALVAAWVPLTLRVDTWVGVEGQIALGALTWALLLWILAGETRLVRAQTVVVVVVATAIELIFSGWLGVYVYRLGHVPMYVFPGHGLVYLAALAFGRLPLVRERSHLAVRLTALVAGGWALWGLLLSPRHDVLGFAWYLCLLAFLRWGRSTTLYVGAFVAVSYLEIIGTRWGVWTWMPRDTLLGWVAQGNPPSVAAGGYGWFDLYAVLLAPSVVRWWDARRGVVDGDVTAPEQSGAPPTDGADDELVA